MAMITPQRAEKIARNINAMDTVYQYSSDRRQVRFWDGLNKKLREIISNLSHEDKIIIADMCDEEQAKYFGLNKNNNHENNS